MEVPCPSVEPARSPNAGTDLLHTRVSYRTPFVSRKSRLQNGLDVTWFEGAGNSPIFKATDVMVASNRMVPLGWPTDPKSNLTAAMVEARLTAFGFMPFDWHDCPNILT